MKQETFLSSSFLCGCRSSNREFRGDPVLRSEEFESRPAERRPWRRPSTSISDGWTAGCEIIEFTYKSKTLKFPWSLRSVSFSWRTLIRWWWRDVCQCSGCRVNTARAADRGSNMNQEVCFKDFKCLNVTQELEPPGLAGLMSEVNAKLTCCWQVWLLSESGNVGFIHHVFFCTWNFINEPLICYWSEPQTI